MQIALRKMGNSTGIIVPKPLLGELGVASGATLDVRVEDGKLVAEPVVRPPRTGWADAAAALAEEKNEPDWQGFANRDDAELRW